MMLFIASAVVFSFVAVEGTICKNSTVCGMGECCYIQPEFMVVSKKQLGLPLQPVSHVHDTGVCEKYHVEDEACYPLETANGHCGCSPGLSCQFVAAPTAHALTLPMFVPIQTKTRKSIYMPGPGTIKCVKK